MAEPAISIIVPVYRTPSVLLQRFLRSASGQSLQDIEIIAVNDASPDDCPGILDEWAAQEPRLRVLHREANGRAGAARNDGLEMATGDYVLFADADDVIRSDMCETLLTRAQRDGADIVGCSWCVVDEGVSIVDSTVLPDRKYDLTVPRQKAKCYRGLNYALWNKLFRRETIAELRFEQFEANIGEDTLFNVAALCWARTMVTTSYIGYEYTSHGASATGRTSKGLSYLRTLALSDQRIRQTLLESDSSPVSGRIADWLTMKRFTTGCGWIARNPDTEERGALWAYWRQHLQEQLLPSLYNRGPLAAWYQMLTTFSGPANVERLTRIATRVVGP